MNTLLPEAQGEAAAAQHPALPTVASRLRYFLWPMDGRYEDLFRGSLARNVMRDFMAGLIVSMVAIPLAMGFAMASGLRPEQGIVGGAVAGLVGALFGGSKYQVYGPTAAYIPIIAGLVAAHGYPFLVLASVLAGVVLLLMGLCGMGRFVNRVPHSIVVGFTIGIACTIALSQVGEVLGLNADLGKTFLSKVQGILAHTADINGYAVLGAFITFLITQYLLKVSPFIPAPLIAIGVVTVLSRTMWADKGLVLIEDRYGEIPANSLVLTFPDTSHLTPDLIGALIYGVLAIVFVAAIESLLCSRMADRLAGNRGLPFHPDKELWGQGMVNILVVMFNGFPHTGALARTATNIRLGAMSPLAGIFKFILKLLLAAYLAHYLEQVPMACIGGILMYVAKGMVKPAEVTEVMANNRFHIGLMVYTALAVLLKDFLTGVMSALVIWIVLKRWCDTPIVGASLVGHAAEAPGKVA